jgi:hypothetical protein
MEMVNAAVLMPPRMPVVGIGNVSCSNGPCTSHGVAQVAIHSQAASQGTGISMPVRISRCIDYLLINYLYLHKQKKL